MLKATDSITTIAARFHDALDRMRAADPELSDEAHAALSDEVLSALRTLATTPAATWPEHAAKLLAAGRGREDAGSFAADALLDTCFADAARLVAA